MIKKYFINFLVFFKQDLAFKCFIAGIFLLASAPFIALIFIIISTAFGLKRNFKLLIKDKLNYLLFGSAFMMILKSIISSFSEINTLEGWEPILNWAGLGNWIPLFIVYMGSQIYIKSSAQRELIAKTIILGTIPVIFSCLTHYYLGWFGPYELFNGLIIWYQRPRTEIYQPVTGLFNNPNYTGAWLSMILPFLLAYLSKKRNETEKYKFVIVFILSILLVISISLINSRGAWLGVFATIPFMFGQNIIFWFLPLCIFLIFSIFACNLQIFSENLKFLICWIIPQNFLSNFNDFTISYENMPRLLIWQESFNLIIQKPFLGWGAASFPVLFQNLHNEWKGHPHNLFLEISISYGLITAILISTFLAIIIYKSFLIFKKKELKNNFYERAWLVSASIFLILHLFDIVYFDFRISIIFWILLSGLRGILNQSKTILKM